MCLTAGVAFGCVLAPPRPKRFGTRARLLMPLLVQAYIASLMLSWEGVGMTVPCSASAITSPRSCTSLWLDAFSARIMDAFETLSVVAVVLLAVHTNGVHTAVYTFAHAGAFEALSVVAVVLLAIHTNGVHTYVCACSALQRTCARETIVGFA